MFYCNQCDRLTDPGERQASVPVEFRDQHYTNSFFKEGKLVTVESDGKEIVKELKLCERCIAIRGVPNDT